MVLTPREVFEVSEKYSVLILDNSRDQTKYWQGLREKEEGIMPFDKDIKKIEKLGIPYFFKYFSEQSFGVCLKKIGRLYARGKFDLADNDSLFIIVFDRSFILRKEKLIPKLLGFIACRVTETTVIIDLVCSQIKGLGTALINYIIRYAEKYNKLNIKLDAATIKLACKFYPNFGFEFTKKEKKARHHKRCLQDGTVNSSGLGDSKMFKMIKTIKKNTLLHYQRSRGVSRRTRSFIRRKKPTSGTRKSRRKTRPPTRFSPGTLSSRTPNSTRLSTVEE